VLHAAPIPRNDLVILIIFGEAYNYPSLSCFCLMPYLVLLLPLGKASLAILTIQPCIRLTSLHHIKFTPSPILLCFEYYISVWCDFSCGRVSLFLPSSLTYSF
jgi:hypothetical protein